MNIYSRWRTNVPNKELKGNKKIVNKVLINTKKFFGIKMKTLKC